MLFPVKRRWLLLPLLLLHLQGWAASGREDSLLKVLQTLPQDTHRVLTYNELFKATFTSEPEKAKVYALTALDLARKLDYKQGIARLCNNLGVWHSKRGDYKESLAYYAQGREVNIAIRDTNGIANCDMNIGNVYYKQGDYAHAIAQYELAVSGYRALGDTVHILDAVNNMGSVYKEQGRYPEALKAYMAALTLRERQNDPVQTALSCLNVGYIYQNQGMLDLAMDFFERALNLSIQGNDKFAQVVSLTSIADVQMDQGQIAASRPLLQDACRLAEEIHDQYGLAAALLSLARLHDLQGEPDSAGLAYNHALKICREIGRTQGIVMALNHIGALQMAQGNLQEAEEALKESLALSDSLQARDLSRDNHKLLASLYAKMGDYVAAYDHQRQFFALHDSIYSSEKTKQIAEMRARYEAQGKQDQINRLNLQATEDKLRIATSSRRNLILLAILLPALLLALIFFMRYLQKQRHNRRIEEKNAEIQHQRDLLETQNKQILEINASLEKIVEARTLALRNAHEELDIFLYQSAHALRRPLLRIDGLSQLIEGEADDATRLSLRENLRTTLGEMDALLHQLIHASESNHREPRWDTIPLKALLAELAPMKRKEAELSLEMPDDFPITSDRYLLSALLAAILDNAFRFQDPHKPQRSVVVTATENDATTTIGIQDNGVGIPPDQLPKVCEMFYRGNNHQGGNGLGLYLAQKICQRLQGSLDIQSELGVGTKVILVFRPTP